MKLQVKTVLLLSTLALIFFSGCQKAYIREKITDGDYHGAFHLLSAPNKNLGTIDLTISSGIYTCNTSLPYNYGAGDIESTEDSLNFKDTLFYIVPAMYVTGYPPSGKCGYLFDGTHLQINRPVNGGEIVYNLARKN